MTLHQGQIAKQQALPSSATSQAGDGHSLARLISFCVVFCGAFYKLPQVIRIHRARSARGVNLMMMVLDCWSNAVEIGYAYANGLPILEWGEVPSQLFCGAVTVSQILTYERGATKLALAVWLGLAAAVTSFLMNAKLILGDKFGGILLQLCKTGNVAVTCSGKLPQILQNSKHSNSGELSSTTTALAVTGSVARFYTLLKSKSIDHLMIYSQATSLGTNATLLGQILWFKGEAGRADK